MQGSNFKNIVRHMQHLVDLQGWATPGTLLRDQPLVKYPAQQVRQHGNALVTRLDKNTGATAVEDAKILTRDEEAAIYEEHWKHTAPRIGLRRIAMQMLSMSAGNRAREICCIRLEQLRMADVSGLKLPGGGMKVSYCNHLLEVVEVAHLHIPRHDFSVSNAVAPRRHQLPPLDNQAEGFRHLRDSPRHDPGT